MSFAHLAFKSAWVLSRFSHVQLLLSGRQETYSCYLDE